MPELQPLKKQVHEETQKKISAQQAELEKKIAEELEAQKEELEKQLADYGPYS